MKQNRVCYMYFANVGICYVDFAYNINKQTSAKHRICYMDCGFCNATFCFFIGISMKYFQIF